MKAKHIAYLGLSLATAFATIGCESDGEETTGSWQAQSRDALSSAHLASIPPYNAAKLCLDAARELEAAGYDREAAVQYERARRFEPDIPKIAHRLAVLYDRTNQTTKALIEYGRALEAEPKNADLLNDIGYFYYSREQWAAAEEYLSRAVDIEANHTRAWTNLAMTYAQQQRYDEAIGAFERVVSTPAAHSNVGMIMAQQGKYSMAKQALNWALSQDPDLVQARTALKWIEMRERTATVPNAPMPEGEMYMPEHGPTPMDTHESHGGSVQSITNHAQPRKNAMFALAQPMRASDHQFVLAPPAPRAIPATWYAPPRLDRRLAAAPSYGNAKQSIPMVPMPKATEALASNPVQPNTQRLALPLTSYERQYIQPAVYRPAAQPAVNKTSTRSNVYLASNRPTFDRQSTLNDQPRIAAEAKAAATLPAIEAGDDITHHSAPSSVRRLTVLHHRGR